MFRYPTPRFHATKLTIYQPTTLDVLQAFKARSRLLSSLGLVKITTPRPLSWPLLPPSLPSEPAQTLINL